MLSVLSGLNNRTQCYATEITRHQSFWLLCLLVGVKNLFLPLFSVVRADLSDRGNSTLTSKRFLSSEMSRIWKVVQTFQEDKR